MSMCPLCNGFREVKIFCEKCGKKMEDNGKSTDYLDDYSPYLDIDICKMVDGDHNSLEKHYCIHLFHCNDCQTDKNVVIQE